MKTYLVNFEESLNGHNADDQFYVSAEDAEEALKAAKERLTKQSRQATITMIQPVNRIPGHPPSN